VNAHLTEALIQAYLDGRASKDEARAVEAHMASCIACRTEVDDWAALFGDLRALPPLTPSPALRARVLEHVTKVRPHAAPSAEWVESAHPTTDRLMDYADHGLPRGVAASVQVHVAECARCATEVAEFRQLFARLDGVGHLSPAVGFQERVMQRVRVPRALPQTAPARALGRRALAAVRRLRPAGRRWAALAGVATAPVAVLAIVASVVLSHPLVTVSGMAAYAWWKVGQVASFVLEPILSGAVQSAALFNAYTALEFLTQSPLATAAGALVFFAFTAGAAWFLYRNVLVASSTGRRYATLRV
jgi:anti-sigma factor RsiW